MKILVIDDEPDVLKQLDKAVSAAEGPDKKPFEVTALPSHQEALKRLETERSDPEKHFPQHNHHQQRILHPTLLSHSNRLSGLSPAHRQMGC